MRDKADKIALSSGTGNGSGSMGKSESGGKETSGTLSPEFGAEMLDDSGGMGSSPSAAIATVAKQHNSIKNATGQNRLIGQ